MSKISKEDWDRHALAGAAMFPFPTSDDDSAATYDDEPADEYDAWEQWEAEVDAGMTELTFQAWLETLRVNPF